MREPLLKRRSQQNKKQRKSNLTVLKARQQAEKMGELIEIDRFTDDCDGSVSDCSFDLIRRMIRGQYKQNLRGRVCPMCAWREQEPTA